MNGHEYLGAGNEDLILRSLIKPALAGLIRRLEG
jgi:hypothetical protein